MIARKIHPQTIIAGWREATKAAREALVKSAVDHGLVLVTDNRHLPLRLLWSNIM